LLRRSAVGFPPPPEEMEWNQRGLNSCPLRKWNGIGTRLLNLLLLKKWEKIEAVLNLFLLMTWEKIKEFSPAEEMGKRSKLC
jgi:hypothetical protein